MTDRPRMRFGDLVPYETPRTLDALHGPAHGTVAAPPNINTSPNPLYDIDQPGQRKALYTATVRDGYPRQQESILNRDILLQLWATLTLPPRCRDIWNARFPALAAIRSTE